jgi:dimethylamine monooxygenase subunit A
MQPGLRRLAEGSRQLHPNLRGSRHLWEKLQALGKPAPAALQCMPGYDPLPGLGVLGTHAACEQPTAFAWDGETASAHLLGWSVRDGELRPMTRGPAPMAEVGACLATLPRAWRLAGLLSLAFAEDFALIDARTAQIPWLAVALPSHWAPEHKVGLHFAQVHGPVADNTMLLAAGDALARLVSAPTRWERFVWTVTPRPTLNAHPALLPAVHWQAADADGVGAQACWRTERQTFIPAPDTGLAVFTILVNTQPLAQAIDRADKAQRLHDAIASMSPAVLQYRGLGPVRDALLDWLARRAAA